MKKIYIGMAVLMACSSTQAQYKKASFLTKSGRTYDLGLSGRFMSESGATAPGFIYSYGRDKGKRMFHWFDLELLFPTKYSYSTINKNDETPMTVSGKSKLSLFYRYNLACYLLSQENTDIKIKPFVTAGVNIVVFGGGVKTYEYSNESGDPQKYVDFSTFSYGGNAGIGGIYNFSEKIGMKLTGGYNWQGSENNRSGYEGYSQFKMISNHPYVTLGVRFTMTGDND